MERKFKKYYLNRKFLQILDQNDLVIFLHYNDLKNKELRLIKKQIFVSSRCCIIPNQTVIRFLTNLRNTRQMDGLSFVDQKAKRDSTKSYNFNADLLLSYTFLKKSEASHASQGLENLLKNIKNCVQGATVILGFPSFNDLSFFLKLFQELRHPKLFFLFSIVNNKALHYLDIEHLFRFKPEVESFTETTRLGDLKNYSRTSQTRDQNKKIQFFLVQEETSNLNRVDTSRKVKQPIILAFLEVSTQLNSFFQFGFFYETDKQFWFLAQKGFNWRLREMFHNFWKSSSATLH